MTKPKTIIIDEVEYVRKDSISTPAPKLDGLEYKIVRCERSGVFAGYVKSRNGREVEILQSRRLWYWCGAASLSQLAQEGVSDPKNCKFPVAMDKNIVLDVIEIIDTTKTAVDSIAGVVPWVK